MHGQMVIDHHMFTFNTQVPEPFCGDLCICKKNMRASLYLIIIGMRHALNTMYDMALAASKILCSNTVFSVPHLCHYSIVYGVEVAQLIVTVTNRCTVPVTGKHI